GVEQQLLVWPRTQLTSRPRLGRLQHVWRIGYGQPFPPAGQRVILDGLARLSSNSRPLAVTFGPIAHLFQALALGWVLDRLDDGFQSKAYVPQALAGGLRFVVVVE